jgi:hypothetical protein
VLLTRNKPKKPTKKLVRKEKLDGKVVCLYIFLQLIKGSTPVTARALP